MFPIQCVTFMELGLQQMGDFYEKNAFYNGKFQILGACKVGVETNLVEQIVWRMWQ